MAGSESRTVVILALTANSAIAVLFVGGGVVAMLEGYDRVRHPEHHEGGIVLNLDISVEPGFSGLDGEMIVARVEDSIRESVPDATRILVEVGPRP